MQPRAAAAGSPAPEPAPAGAPSFQARLWKNLQLGVAKSKGSGRAAGQEPGAAATPSPSPPPPGGRRDPLAAAGGSGGRWMGFKKRKQVLDRVFSSSQPNLCCSSPEPLEPGGPGGGEQGPALRRRLREHLLPAGKGRAAAGAGAETPPGGRSPDSAPSSSSASSSVSSSPQPPPRGDRARDEGARGRGPAAHLCHQKSSSLPGNASLEQLLGPPPRPPPPPPAEPARGPAEPRTPAQGEPPDGSQVSAPRPAPRLQLRGPVPKRCTGRGVCVCYRVNPTGKKTSRTYRLSQDKT